MSTPRIDVLPEPLDLALYAGDTFKVILNFAAEGGGTWDASGTWRAQARLNDATVAAFAVDTTEALMGRIQLTLTGAQTRTLAGAGKGVVWDVEQDVGGEIKTWYKGKVTVTQDVTSA